MYQRITRFFDRYALRHWSVDQTLEVSGKLGKISGLHLDGAQVTVTGTSTAQSVTFSSKSRQVSRLPDESGAFDITIPLGEGDLSVTFTAGTDVETIPLAIPQWKMNLAKARLAPVFGMQAVQAVPPVLRWFRHQDPAARLQVRSIFRLDPQSTVQKIDDGLFEPSAVRSSGPVTVIVPVYNGYDFLPEMLHRLKSNTTVQWHGLVIDDGSPDERIWPLLQDLCDHPNLTLLRNDHNLGFIRTVNRGFKEALAREGHVIILNTDAFVPKGWAERLLAPIDVDPTVASVTPFSNDAEIGCAPVICGPVDLPEGAADAIDTYAAGLSAGTVDQEAPTGVGFCMAMNRAFLEQVPEFDTVFGRGYGEETDWCQKVRALGGKHVYRGDIYVEHRGGASFGKDDKLGLVMASQKTIGARYPGYALEVQQFIEEDPFLSHRLALALSWAGQTAERPVDIYIAHDLGGGAEHYLQDQIAEADQPVVVVRIGAGYRWQVEMHGPTGVTKGATDSREMLVRLLAPIERRRVIYSTAVSDLDPVEIPDVILELADGQAIDVLFHDFFPLSPSYTLLDDKQRFVLPLDPASKAHQVFRPDGSTVRLPDWHEAWGRVFVAADQLVVFSASSQRILAEVIPQWSDKVALVPHQMKRLPTPVTSPRGSKPVIGILGNIGGHKGGAFVNALSRHLAKTGEARLVIVGNMDPALNIHRSAKITGDYDVDQIADLAERHAITMWFIPSIWPETFSFTTHEAIATGLPVSCFDLGAPADAVRSAGFTPIPLGTTDENIAALVQLSAKSL